MLFADTLSRACKPAATVRHSRYASARTTYNKRLQSEIVKPDPQKVDRKHTRIKLNYDSHAKALKMLSTDDSIRIKPTNRTEKKWECGTLRRSFENQS